MALSVDADWRDGLGGESVMSEENSGTGGQGDAGVSRRRALARLGIAASVAYMAPTVLPISRNRHAFAISTPCPQADGNPNNNPPSCPP